MKKLKMLILAASVFVGVLFLGQAKAQINISINIGSQPEWGPTGYDHVDYYYLPDINAYYDVNTGQYIYLRGNKWRFAKRLPNRYRNYDIYNSYKVVVNRPYPYNNYQMDQARYGQYRGRRSQPILRDHRSSNYNNYNQVQRKTIVVNHNSNQKKVNSPSVKRTTTVTKRNADRKVTTRRSSTPTRTTVTRKATQNAGRR